MNNIQKVTDAIVQQGMLPLYFNADDYDNYINKGFPFEL